MIWLHHVIFSVNFLVPDKEFKELINNYQLTNKELANYFLVTEEFKNSNGSCFKKLFSLK